MMVRAEQWWVCETQRCLTNNDKFHIMKRQLNLFQDPQGRWCCEGRIHNANLPYSTQLVVLHAHERVFHNGVKETLTEIRSQYWITNGGAVVRKLIHSCITCWRLEALAYMAPRPPPLPPLRVTEAPVYVTKCTVEPLTSLRLHRVCLQSVLTKRMKRLNCVISHFWRRWKFQYLLELRNHHKNKTRGKGSSADCQRRCCNNPR